MADGRTHSPHLAISPLADRQLDPVLSQTAGAGGGAQAIVELDPAAQRRERAL